MYLSLHNANKANAVNATCALKHHSPLMPQCKCKMHPLTHPPKTNAPSLTVNPSAPPTPPQPLSYPAASPQPYSRPL